MAAPCFHGMSTTRAQALWNGESDDHGNAPERAISDGKGNPCRHCLQMIAKDNAFLILSLRPFASRQPYAEQGPVFLHAEPCEAFAGDSVPPVLADSPSYMMRGYGADERIIYGTGGVRPTADLLATAQDLLVRDGVAFVDIRSASNNCWQARVKADPPHPTEA